MDEQRYTFRVEKYWANIFLQIYNTRLNKQFHITKQNDQASPDIECEDSTSKIWLGLEIKRFASIPRDIAVDSQLAQGKLVEFGESLGRRGDVDLIIEELKNMVDCLRDTSYKNMFVALLLPSVFQIWTCREFISIAGQRLKNIALPIAENFKAGVWFFCKDNERKDSMLNLLDF